MVKKCLICILCFLSLTISAGEITKGKLFAKSKTLSKASTSHKIYIKDGLNKKIKNGKYTIVLTRIDDRMNRIHLNSKPRNNALVVEAFDRSEKKMKALSVGNNLSTATTSNHKYIYKNLPEYLIIK